MRWGAPAQAHFPSSHTLSLTHTSTHRDWTKHTNYESATRAPLIIRSPAHPQSHGRTVTALTQHLDIFPTLLELAGLADSPAAAGLQGHSLVPLLQDPSAPALAARPFAYSQYPRKQSACPGFECDDAHAMGYTIRTPQWRFTQWVDYNNNTFLPNFDPATSKTFAQELYDHSGDSDGKNWTGFELHNLVKDPAYAEVVKNLTALLHAGPNLLKPTVPSTR
jgi:iduronate 2-sulfatase